MEKEATVLDYLREQFARLHTKLDRIAGDVTNLKVRMSGLEADAGYSRVAMGEINARLDRMDDRLERVERRLNLVDSDGPYAGVPEPGM